MSRVLEAVNWLLVFPYGYGAFLLGAMVGDNSRTPPVAAVVFWVYLAFYPVTVVACSLAARDLRRTGRAAAAIVASMLPFGVLAAAFVLFPAFVDLLATRFR